MKLIRNTNGFAHPILLLVVMVGLVGVIAYTGQQVISRSSQKQQAAVSSQAPILITADEAGQDDAQRTLQIDDTGSAAAESRQQAGADSGAAAQLPARKDVSTKHNISTPLGSLSQLIHEAKTGDYHDALYFVTPRLMLRAYDSIQARNLTDFARLCQTNSACDLLRVTDISINRDHITESDCYGESYDAECRKLSTKFALKNGKLMTEHNKTVGYGHHTITIYMLRFDGSTKWVADKVTVDLDNEGGRSSYTL